MSLANTISKVERVPGWSFLGFILAILFGGLSIYTEFWKNNSPIVVFELLSNTPVIDVRENLPELEVLYQKQDIAKEGQALSVMLVRAINHGTENVVSGDYDAKVPLGLKVTNAKLIKAEIVSASNEYLRKVASALPPGDDVVIFEPAIIEPGESFVVKLLVLHNAETQPAVIAQGKIAGMHAVPKVIHLTEDQSEGFWESAFSGGVWTQLVRLVAYFLGTIALMVLLIAPPTAISSALGARKRRNVVARFKKVKKLSDNKSDDYIFSTYIENGLRSLERLRRILTDERALQERANAAMNGGSLRDVGVRGSVDAVDVEEMIYVDDVRRGHYLNQSDFTIKRLIRQGFVVKEDETWKLIPERLQMLDAFIEFVDLVGAE